MHTARYVVACAAMVATGWAWSVWFPVGPVRRPVRCAAMNSGSPPTMLVVAAEGIRNAIYRSTNGGGTWSRLSDSLEFIPEDIVFDPAADSVVYAAGAGLFKSTDRGVSWHQLRGPDHCWCSGLAAVPSSPSELWVAGSARSDGIDHASVGRSTDRGMTWSLALCDTNRSFGYSVLRSSTDTGLVWCSGFSNGRSVLYRSSDRGLNWTTLLLPPAEAAGPPGPGCGLCRPEPREEPPWGRLHSFCVHPEHPDTIIAAVTSLGLYRTVDGGLSWSLTAIPNGVYSLAAAPGAPDVLYAGTNGELLFSRNGGIGWTRSPVGGGAVGAILVPDDGTDAWAATASGILETTNGGWVWDTRAVFPTGRVGTISATSGQPAALYAAVDGLGIFRADSGVRDWLRCGSFPGSDSLASLAAGDSGVAWALPRGTSSPAGVFRSTNGGMNWVATDTWLELGGALAVSPLTRSVVCAVGSRCDSLGAQHLALALTTDSGTTWTHTLLGRGFTGRTVAMHPTSPAIFLLAGDSSGSPALFRTTDTGATWARVGAGLAGRVNSMTFNTGTNIYCGTTQGVYRSTDQGTNWAYNGLAEVRAVIVQDGWKILAATRTGVFLNQGSVWTPYNYGLIDVNTYSIISAGWRLYVGTNSAGVFSGQIPVGVVEPSRTPELSDPRIPTPTIYHRMLRLADGAQAALFDLLGRKVTDLKPGENDIGQLAPGVYFVRRPVTEDGGSRTAVRKIVIQR
ncbi:MAG: hypothetical protein JSU73_09665 [candidate division WOR-3 bacterium]|nr:MAG: hypothetical protein JSU73_09665 [candidate division WOR-3 bacterium]